jgi:hypothetical protein
MAAEVTRCDDVLLRSVYRERSAVWICWMSVDVAGCCSGECAKVPDHSRACQEGETVTAAMAPPFVLDWQRFVEARMQ